MSIEHDKIADAWRLAARDLDIEVVAPFSLDVDGRKHKYLALVPHFGGGRGIVVAALPSDHILYRDAKSADYRCSFVNPELYGEYDRVLFVETLAEWGFTGPAERRPEWLAEVSGL